VRQIYKKLLEKQVENISIAPTSADIKNIYQKITMRVQQQYIITFIDNTEAGSVYYIKVKVYYSQIFGEAEKYIQL